MAIAPIEEILEEIRAGRLIVLVDDDSADGEGFLCAAAENITTEAVNFMMRHARGLICLGLPEVRMKQLGIPLKIGRASCRGVGSVGAAIALRAQRAHH